MPDAETEEKLLLEAYDYVNDLYTDEHLIMTQADLLEQLHGKPQLVNVFKSDDHCNARPN